MTDLKRLRAFAAAAIAPSLLLILLIKALSDLDLTWDSWTYHYPFAARLWDIIPARDYRMETNLEAYYLGHPLLGEWLEGLLWKITGIMQTTNLVSLGSFILFVLFLRQRFDVPLGASLVGLLAIPLVQAHATLSYVDLPANIALSGLILLTWEILVQSQPNPRKFALPLLLCSAVAANMKLQMLPLVVAILPIAAAKLWSEYKQQQEKPILKALGIVFFALLITLYIPIRNTIWFGNPLYPFHLVTSLQAMDGVDYPIPYFSRGFPPLSWLMSVLEVNRPLGNWKEPLMGIHVTLPGDREGGFFNLYVIAQLVFFAIYCLRRHDARVKRTALFFAYLTFLIAVIPQGYELRYYQFWMITLVSLNLILWRRADFFPALKRLIPVVNVGAFLFVAAMTQGAHLLPQNFTLERTIAVHTDPKLLEEVSIMKDGETQCIYRRQPFTFLYASYWHRLPPHRYRIIARRSRDHCDGDPNQIP